MTLYNLMVKGNLWDKADSGSDSVPDLNQVIYILSELLSSKVLVFIWSLRCCFSCMFSVVALKNSLISCQGPTKISCRKSLHQLSQNYFVSYEL